jgi:hypothetical protein
MAHMPMFALTNQQCPIRCGPTAVQLSLLFHQPDHMRKRTTTSSLGFVLRFVLSYRSDVRSTSSYRDDVPRMSGLETSEDIQL